jgi:hypothetical protein
MNPESRPHVPRLDDLIAIDVREVDGAGSLTVRRVPGETQDLLRPIVIRYSPRPLGGFRFQFQDGSSQEVHVERFPMPNGGHRRFFALDGRRWRKLYLSPHEPRLVTRSRLGLGYRSASLGGRETERLALRADRITSAIGGLGGTIIRPSGMRRKRWLALIMRLGELRTGPSIGG